MASIKRLEPEQEVVELRLTQREFRRLDYILAYYVARGPTGGDDQKAALRLLEVLAEIKL